MGSEFFGNRGTGHGNWDRFRRGGRDRDRPINERHGSRPDARHGLRVGKALIELRGRRVPGFQCQPQQRSLHHQPKRPNHAARRRQEDGEEDPQTSRATVSEEETGSRRQVDSKPEAGAQPVPILNGAMTRLDLPGPQWGFRRGPEKATRFRPRSRLRLLSAASKPKPPNRWPPSLRRPRVPPWPPRCWRAVVPVCGRQPERT